MKLSLNHTTFSSNHFISDSTYNKHNWNWNNKGGKKGNKVVVIYERFPISTEDMHGFNRRRCKLLQITGNNYNTPFFFFFERLLEKIKRKHTLSTKADYCCCSLSCRTEIISVSTWRNHVLQHWGRALMNPDSRMRACNLPHFRYHNKLVIIDNGACQTLLSWSTLTLWKSCLPGIHESILPWTSSGDDCACPAITDVKSSHKPPVLLYVRKAEGGSQRTRLQRSS